MKKKLKKTNINRIIFIDIDNTLLARGHKGKISQENINEIKNAQKKGIYTVLCTGRDVRDAINLQKEIYHNKFGKYLITSNGSVVTDIEKDKFLFEKEIHKNDVKKLSDHFNSRKLPYMISYERTFWINSHFKFWYMRPFFHNVKWVNSKKLILKDEPARKIGVIAGTKKRVRKEFDLINKLDISNKLELTTSGSGFFIEINKKGISKASGAKYLSKLLKIPLKNCAALGDSMNDYEIFKVVGMPIAMKNSNKKLKDVAKFETDLSKNNGVAKSVKNIYLNNLK